MVVQENPLTRGVIGPTREEAEELNKLTGPIPKSHFGRWGFLLGSSAAAGIAALACGPRPAEVREVTPPQPTATPFGIGGEVLPKFSPEIDAIAERIANGGEVDEQDILKFNAAVEKARQEAQATAAAEAQKPTPAKTAEVTPTPEGLPTFPNYGVYSVSERDFRIILARIPPGEKDPEMLSIAVLVRNSKGTWDQLETSARQQFSKGGKPLFPPGGVDVERNDNLFKIWASFSPDGKKLSGLFESPKHFPEYPDAKIPFELSLKGSGREAFLREYQENIMPGLPPEKLLKRLEDLYRRPLPE